MSQKDKEPTTAAAIKSFLETRPLYASIEIVSSLRGEGPFTQEQVEKQTVPFPLYLDLYCESPECQRTMRWEHRSGPYRTYTTPSGIPFTLSRGWSEIAYLCRHCGRSVVTFFFWLSQRKAPLWDMQKVGQHPRSQAVLSEELTAGLGEQGRELYLKADESRRQEMGLGALAYLRRVVENGMNALLDLMKSAVVGADNETELLARVEAAKQEKVFTNKVGFAKAVLPQRFFHGGHNPLERLHQWSSAGIHDRDEWECIEIFDEIRTLFELLFERLAREAAEKRIYDKKLIDLTRKK
jgi:hypothetical protein